ncbi:MAG: HPP family protein [Nitrospirota bacterium]|jgi:CBS-domain-containing membrane protein
MSAFFSKMRGGGQSPPRVDLEEIAWSWVGSFCGILAVAYLSHRFMDPRDLTLVIGSFGASAVLIYAAIKSPLAQPWNLVGGHVFSSLVGVTCYKLAHPTWLAAALAVSLAIVVMHLLKCLHPPGGATALIAVIGSAKIHALGYLYVLVPAALGALIMLTIALITNNLARHRRYPEYWF